MLRGAVVLLVLILTAGCGLFTDRGGALPEPTLSPVPPETSATEEGSPTAGAGLEEFYEQELDWSSCSNGHECATLEVPLDYADPAGERIELALLRVPSPRESQRIGSLVVNPGGPGGSGVQYAEQARYFFGPELLQAFDVVGFDPRGVGESTPVDCLSDEELDEFIAADPDPDTPAEVDEGMGMLREFGEGCLEHSGALAEHMSTEEAARDIDIIRAALGDATLNYFGASYGTFLGATYADLFPDRVGRMVLDGAIDPSVSTREMSVAQARGFETALRAYVGSCVDAGRCFLGNTVDRGTQRIREFLDEVEQRPLETQSGRMLEVGNAVLGIWAPLYNEDYWSLLDGALLDAFEGSGQQLLALSDAYTSRGPDGYVDNSIEALYAVNCLDHADAMPARRIPGMVAEFEEVSPTFGAIFAWGLAGCVQWPAENARIPGPVTAAGAAPILVVGTTRDPATPLEWAEALADQLDSGVLVRREGDGHTGYRAGNACVDQTVESYLVSGDVPAGPVDC